MDLYLRRMLANNVETAVVVHVAERSSSGIPPDSLNCRKEVQYGKFSAQTEPDEFKALQKRFGTSHRITTRCEDNSRLQSSQCRLLRKKSAQHQFDLSTDNTHGSAPNDRMNIQSKQAGSRSDGEYIAKDYRQR